MSSQNPVGQFVANPVALELGVTSLPNELSSAGISLEGLPAPTLANSARIHNLISSDVHEAAPTTKPSGSFSRSEPSRQSKPPSSTRKDRDLGQPLSGRLFKALRSRRVRAGLTCVGLLLVGGLFALNFREPNRSAVERNELTEMELTELGEGDLTSNRAADTASESSLFVSNSAPANRLQAVSATRPRGAWLTGLIELDSNAITPAAAEWSNSGDTSGGVTPASAVDRFQRRAP